MRLVQILILGSTAALLFLLHSCATTIPPTGGPKDTIPPSLIRSKPTNNQTNFEGKEITLEFTEQVILKEPKEEIIITPSPGKDILYTYRRNVVTIQSKNPLERDVTYSIAFRQAVRDITESLPAEDLKLAFSTGAYIDSLQVYGSVMFLPDGTNAAKYTVAIFKEDTFNIFKHTPAYFTKADKNGRFSIRNLKPGKYRLYAFEDKNKNLKCDSQSERFGLYPDTVYLPQQSDSLRLNAVKVDCRPLKLSNYRNISDYGLIRLNKNIVSYFLREHANGIPVQSIASPTKAEITYYPRETSEDSIRVVFHALDSIGQTIDSIFFIKKTRTKPIKETFKVGISESIYTHTTGEWRITTDYSHPLISKIPDSINLYIDTIFHKAVAITSVMQDSLLPRLTFYIKHTIKDSLISKGWITTFREASFISLRKDTAKAVSKKVTVRTKENMARLIVHQMYLKDNLTELIGDKPAPIESQETQITNTFKNLDPSRVYIRRVDDVNRNGKWDYGNPLKNIPPESIKYYLNSEGKRDVPLRANWEVEIDWIKDTIVDKKPSRTAKKK